MAGERSCAAFLLQLGLRSIAAGNTAAARARFEQCQAELEQQVEAGQQQQAAGAGTDNQPAGGSGPADVLLLCRLGAVRGCLGDCCRAEGDAEGTLAHYQESVRLLQAAGDDAEATQALSVALNKVGELRHLQGDLAAAAEQYAAALRLRRALLAARQRQWAGEGSGEPREGGSGAAAAAAGEEAGAGSEACCSAALDLAASCLKLSGARAGLGESGEAEALLTEAEALLQGLDAPGQLAAQPERLRRKQASLAQFAAMMQRQRQQQQVLDKRQ
ncbi:zinc ion-binding [Micractinium conductrix]|uniref:Zinc ion-binding n=1 Tax=Micractinium conductrix TaxID=554055 RepID=A0A2P6V808_9CHLO|nr:zinc ion-binding [Micractinium conductrix]|eukprot:PSC70221.1 zinc ion-binding [Micractinium conductrix]